MLIWLPMLLKEVVDGLLGPSLEVGEFAGRIAFPNFMAMTLSGLAVALIEMVHGVSYGRHRGVLAPRSTNRGRIEPMSSQTEEDFIAARWHVKFIIT